MPPTNPYQPPQSHSDAPRRSVWPWVGLAGVMGMVVSAAALCGTVEFRQGGMTFYSAGQALMLFVGFVLSALCLAVASIGWLVFWMARRPAREQDSADSAT